MHIIVFNFIQESIRFHINLMSLRKQKPSIKQQNRSFHEHKILTDILNPIPLDPKLIWNPFLHGDDKYQYLMHKLKQFDHASHQNQVKDSYQIVVSDRLRSLMITIGTLLTRDIQREKLQEVYTWFVKEEQLVQQRRNQGDIRYKVTKQYLSEMGKDSSPKFLKSAEYKHTDYKSMLPSEVTSHQNLPFIKKWRTVHKELQTPDVRLKEYHRKSLNLDPTQFMSEKKAKEPARIKYPKMERVKYSKQYEVEEGITTQQQGEIPKQQNNPNTNPQNPQVPVTDIKQGQKPAQQEQQQAAGQDLGLGQQPQDEPEQQEPQQQQDKLAPRLKSYILEVNTPTKQQNVGQKRMNDRYLKIQNDYVRKNNEDKQLVELMESWAAKKNQMDKEIMKRIQNMGINYDKYKFSYEDPQKQQIFSVQDGKKYGLNKTFDVRVNPSKEINIYGEFELPNIKNKNQIYQKSIRKDKLNVLKKKFGKMLDIKDYEERQVAQSMCQVKEERKGFSELLRKHSKSKERIKQLDEAVALKEKLAREKISIDITALSKSLCLYEDEQKLPDASFPVKDLLKNPFWIQPAKKKKKK